MFPLCTRRLSNGGDAMICCYCRGGTLLRVWRNNNVEQLQNPSLLLLVKFISTVTQNQQEDSFTVSYLINSCGLSRDSALSASKYVKFSSPDHPDSVLHLLKTHGFSQKHITKSIRRFPTLLSSHPERTLTPKLDYLYSIGVSRPELVKVITWRPGILLTSLQKRLMPFYDYLQAVLQSHKKATAAFTRDPRLLMYDPEGRLKPNIRTMKDLGARDSVVVCMLHNHPSMLLTPLRRFSEVVENVRGMGFNPSSVIFTQAMKAIMGNSKSTWEKKLGAYQSWGWSEEASREAFLKNPICILSSEDKIMATMDFFVNKMGFDSSCIARNPTVFTYSLERRIVPRCLVIRALLSKGLIKDYKLTSFLSLTAPKFEQKFLTPFLADAPELLEIYEDKKLRPQFSELQIEAREVSTVK